MIKCKYCNFDNYVTAKFCRNCGSPIEETDNKQEQPSISQSSSNDKSLNWLWCTLCWIGLIADVIGFFCGVIPRAVAVPLVMGLCLCIKNYS